MQVSYIAVVFSISLKHTELALISNDIWTNIAADVSAPDSAQATGQMHVSYFSFPEGQPCME